MSVVVSAAITAVAITLLWSELDVKTDLVGYPIFADFNPYNYFNAYHLVAGFFPVAALALFLLLTRVGPRFGLAAPPARGTLRPPSRPASTAAPALEGDPPLAGEPETKRRVVTTARIAFVGAVLGVEAGIVTNHVWGGPLLGIAIYTLAIFVSAASLERWGGGSRSLKEWLHVMNAIAAPLTVLGLFAVSSNTEVRLLSDGTAHHYPWFPIWLAVPAAAILIAAIVSRLRSSGARPIVIERRALLLIAAPVCIFLLLAELPGNQTTFETFEAGQRLAAGRLVEDGWFPWRDVLVVHGLLADAVGPMISFAIFENSYWGDLAGSHFLLSPLYILSLYFLFVYLFGRNWLFLLFAGLVVLDGTLVPGDFRFILWPLILLLLAAVLNHPTRVKTIALAALGVGQTIVTPESAPALFAITVVLVLYEWYRREPRTRVASSFSRTLWFVGAGFGFASAFVAYMASRGALDDFAYISSNLIRGHILDGALPPGPSTETTSHALFYFLALAPPAALLISFAYAVARVRLRRGFLTEDWVMAAVAIFLFFYYSKFLSRMDNHVYQPFVQAVPLMLYIVYRGAVVVEGAIRKRWPGGLVLRWTAHPVCLALVVAMALTSSAWRDRLADAGDRYSAVALEEPAFQKVGFVESFEAIEYRDLRNVIDAYLDPDDRLFDLTGEPGVFYYLMDRDPATRYIITNSITDTAELQSDVINRLRKARPKLIVYDNADATFFGNANYDGTPSMVRQYLVSQWILDRYRPLLMIHGHTFYARRDLPPVAEADLTLSEKPVTRGVEFLSQQCAWGYAPSFLSGPGRPGPGATAIDASVHRAPGRITIVGWAGDPEEKLPAREVIATLDGKVVGRTEPNITRPDLVDYGLPNGFLRSGFRIQITASLPEGSGKLRVYAVSRSGDLSELVSQGERPSRGRTQLGRRQVNVDPSHVWGQLNSVVRDRSLTIDLPPGSRWNDYRWLAVEAGEGGFKDATFAVYDRRRRTSAGREITFRTFDRSPRHYVVPVGNCAQWHGYGSRRLFLNFYRPQDIAAVRLIREPGVGP